MGTGSADDRHGSGNSRCRRCLSPFSGGDTTTTSICEKQRREAGGEVRESPKLRAISVKTEAANEEKQRIEESLKRLPELTKIMELAEKETDNQKKRELQDKYNRLLSARRLSSPAWQKTEIASQQLGRQYIFSEETLIPAEMPSD